MPAYSFDCNSYMTNSAMGHDQDIHYKMSKKIAQLTKVICMLNSRSEDSVDLLKQKSKLHEFEINELKNSYNSKIRDLEASLEKERSISSTMSRLEKCVEEKDLKIIDIESKYNQLLNEHHLKEESMKVKYDEEIVKLQQTLVEYQERYDKELNSVQHLAEQWKSHQCPSVESILNEKLQLEAKLENLGEKYSSLEMEVECRIKVLTDSYEHKIQEMVKSVKDEEAQKQNQLLAINKNLLNDLKNQQYIYEQLVIKNNEEKNELTNHVKNTTENNLNNHWQDRLNQERDEFQNQLSKLHKSNEEIKYNLENRIQSLESKYDQLKTEYGNYQQKTKLECERLRKEIEDLHIVEENLKKELITKDEKLITLEKEENDKYFQLRKERDELLEKMKITKEQLETKMTLIIVSYKAQNQFDEQKLILASKYEDIRAKLKESQKLLKTSENKLQSLRSQLSTKESDFTNLKENLKLKLQSMKKLNADYLLSTELIRTELSHIRKILNEELKTKYESYCDSLLVQKTADLRKRLYNEIEHRINKDKESAINNLTLAKQNEIDQLQQVNNELKRKMSKQRQEFENKITKTRNQLEEAINKEKSKLEDISLLVWRRNKS
ncbi:unnamed protein product [Heterobilharzia americana]|nr:unnamed protein product [Heterobilharzia americana]